MSTPTPTHAIAQFLVLQDNADDFMDSWVDSAKEDAIAFPSEAAEAHHACCVAVADAMYRLSEAWRLLDENPAA